MATVAEALAQAVENHRTGRLQEAEFLYKQILAVAPNHPDAWHLLGVLAHQAGKHDIAIDYIERAIQVNGGVAAFHNNLGEAYRQSNQLPEAVACYQKALQLKPNYFEAFNNLGLAKQQQGNAAEAVTCFQRVLEIKPDHAEAYNNLGIALKDQGRFIEAIGAYQQALRLKQDFAEAHSNLGVVWKECGDLTQAVDCYRRALQLKPDSAETHNNLGVALMEMGRPEDAVVCYDQALRLRANYAAAHNNLGNALTELGQSVKAITCFQAALQYEPTFAAAHNNLGNALREQQRTLEAIGAFRQALQLNTQFVETLVNLCSAFEELGQIPEAIACCRRALELEPNRLSSLHQLVYNLQHVCDWTELKTLAPRVEQATPKRFKPRECVPPFWFIASHQVNSAQQQLQCALRWVDGFSAQGPKSTLKLKPRAAKSKITLGYLSADFREHATAYLIAELLEKHDRRHFSIHAYSYGPDENSAMRQRLVKGVDHFIDIRATPFPQAAQRITDDGVDILIDLKGYTQGARVQIPALRPAPIQVNYLGFPGTMGASFIDYILVDDFVVHPDQQPFFTEKLVHLPGCYQVNDSQREIASPTPSRLECGLPEEGFVFCSFNNSYKITPAMFDVWMQLLKAVPGSVLWLLEGNSFAPDNLRREAQARGVATERLVFAPRLAQAHHLARQRLADLFLDTFPVNAHTTASDALWAGCPVLTLAGQTFASRVAGSLLRTIGLPELITTSFEDYHDLAFRLAQDRSQLAEFKLRMEANRMDCGLFDGERFARKVEKAYTKMWQIHVSGEKPTTFKVSEL